MILNFFQLYKIVLKFRKIDKLIATPYNLLTICLTLYYMKMGAFLPSAQFFCDKSLSKKDFHSELTYFELNLITNTSLKFEVTNVKESFPILRFAKVTFRNLSIFDQPLSQMTSQDVL